MAFKSVPGSGLSIFDIACAEAASSLICAHIEAFYKNVGGDPAVFLIVADEEWPAGYQLDATPSDSGDDCHREVVGVKDKHIKKALMKRPWSDYLICAPDGVRPLTAADIASFIEAQDRMD